MSEICQTLKNPSGAPTELQSSKRSEVWIEITVTLISLFFPM